VVATVLTPSLALGGCERGGLKFTDGFSDHEVEVVGVSSVRIGTDIYVLAGIETPSPAPNARCWAEALLAREARMALDAMVRTSARVHTNHEQQLPSGHVAARVEVNGEDLSEAMVTAGLAVRSTGTPFSWCGPIDPTSQNAPELGHPAAFAPTSTHRVESGKS
jgi:endonuclease YncB( thermonuclease family)